MRLGYSLLLLDYVEAAQVTYEDCKSFQITCPACREPIYKVVRKDRLNHLHYLSHYSAEAAYGSECELRVGRLTESVIDESRVAGRGQRLALFMSVIAEAIVGDRLFPFHREAQDLFSRSKALRTFGSEVRRRANKTCPDRAAFDKVCANYLADIRLGGERAGAQCELNETSLLLLRKDDFSSEVQRTAAFEVYRHLLSEPVSANFDLLWRYAAFHLLFGRIGNNVRVMGPDSLNDAQAEIVEFLMGLLRGNRRRCEALLAQSKTLPSREVSNASLYSVVAAKIINELVGTLLRLPYADLLRKAHQRKVDARSPLHAAVSERPV